MGRRHASGACGYCESRVYPPGSAEARANPKMTATKDHVLPQLWKKPVNGITTVANIMTACRGCNEVKGSYPEEPFRFFLKQTHGTAQFTHAEFKRFIFGLALAGFRAARRDALAHRLARPAPSATAPRGRYTKRDLKKAR